MTRDSYVEENNRREQEDLEMEREERSRRHARGMNKVAELRRDGLSDDQIERAMEKWRETQ